MSNQRAERDLLWGVLALQQELITREALCEATLAWSRDRSRPLEEIMREHGALSTEGCSILAPLVEAHLNARLDHAECETLADISRTEQGTLPDSPLGDTVRPDEAEGAVGGRFVTLREHARGALGVVSVAMDTELSREVALKEIQPNLANDQLSRTRFWLEAEVTGKLEHPGVVPVYGMGTDSRGRPYYAMRLIKGESLRTAISRFHAADSAHDRIPAQRTLELRQLIRRFIDVCNAVGYAHSRGVIHRDLKPSNIMLGPYGETLVVDWGLAKVIGRKDQEQARGGEETLRTSSGTGSSETVAGTVVGTPSYMSPEQAEGWGEQVTPLSDVYSLGATLYCILAGRPPVEGAVNHVLSRVRRGEIAPVREAKPGVPKGLDAICRKAMAHEPGDRYPSPAELTRDLEHWLADEPVSAWEEPWDQRLSRWERRNRTLIRIAGASLAIVALMATAAFALVTRAWGSAESARQTEYNMRLAADRNLKEVRALSNRLRLDRGIHLCQGGDLNAGLLTFAACLGEAEAAGESELVPILRANLAAWGGRISRPRSMIPHPDRVHTLAVRKDGRLIATGCLDGKVRLFDPATGLAVGQPIDAGAAVTQVIFHPDMRRLLVRTSANRVQFWDVETGKAIGSPIEHCDAVCVALSPDGKSVATFGFDARDLRFWDADTFRPVGKSVEHAFEGPVLMLAFRPDGKVVATAGWDRRVRFWEVASGNPTGPEIRHEEALQAVAFSPDGQRVLSGGWDKLARLWDASTGRAIGQPMRHRSTISDVGFSADGRTLLTAGWDNCVKLWDAASGKPIGTSMEHLESVAAAAISPDGRTVISVGNDRLARTWDAPTFLPTTFTTPGQGAVCEFRYNRDATAYVVLNADGVGQQYDAKTHRPLGSSFQHPSGPRRSLYSPDGRHLVTYLTPESLYGQGVPAMLWDLSVDPPRGTPLDHPLQVAEVAFLPDGKTFLTGCFDGKVRSWDCPSGRSVGKPLDHPERVVTLRIDPEGETAVVATTEASYRWDLASGSPLGTRIPFPRGFVIVSYFQDCRSLVLGTGDGSLQHWDIERGKLKRKPIEQRGPISALFLDADSSICASLTGGTLVRRDLVSGRVVGPAMPEWENSRNLAVRLDKRLAAVSAASDRAQLWDLDSAKPVGPPLAHRGEVTALEMSPDGKTLLVGNEGGEVRIWSFPPLLEGTPGQVAAWAQVLTGMELGTNGETRRLDAETWLEKRRGIEADQ